MLRVLLVMVSAVSAQGPNSDGPFPNPVRLAIEPFNYHGVSLDDGPLWQQVSAAREDYLRIPNDDLLKGFRKRAGLPAPGALLGGWYSSDVFHVFGQILSGLARLYAVTGDPSCRDKADALLRGWPNASNPTAISTTRGSRMLSITSTIKWSAVWLI